MIAVAQLPREYGREIRYDGNNYCTHNTYSIEEERKHLY